MRLNLDISEAIVFERVSDDFDIAAMHIEVVTTVRRELRTNRHRLFVIGTEDKEVLSDLAEATFFATFNDQVCWS